RRKCDRELAGMIVLVVGDHADAGLDAIVRADFRPRGESLSAIRLACADFVDKADYSVALALVGTAKGLEPGPAAVGGIGAILKHRDLALESLLGDNSASVRAQ